MVSRIRVNNIAETGHTISVHLRKISNGFIVNNGGAENHYPTFEEAEEAYLNEAKAQKQRVKEQINTEIDRLTTAIESIDSLYEEAIRNVEEELQNIKDNEG